MLAGWRVGEGGGKGVGGGTKHALTTRLADMTTFIFPTHGNGLTAVKSSVLDPDPSLPPPRKAPKIAASSSVHTPRDSDRKRAFRIVTNTRNLLHI